MGLPTRPLALLCASGVLATQAPGQERLHLDSCVQETLGSSEVCVYAIRAEAGEDIFVEVSSRDFTPSVLLQGPGISARSSSEPARVCSRMRGGGEVRLTVQSAEASRTGIFRITLSRGMPMCFPLGFGQTVQGSLRPGDMRTLAGGLCDQYEFTGQAGQQVRIHLLSNSFDAYLTLRTPSGGQAEDDDSGGNLNAEIDRVLNEDGDYIIEVSTLQPGGQGAYVLAVH